jgi:hypothetical protein
MSYWNAAAYLDTHTHAHASECGTTPADLERVCSCLHICAFPDFFDTTHHILPGPPINHSQSALTLPIAVSCL